MERLLKYKPLALRDNEELNKYMLRRGRVGTAKVLEEGERLRVYYADDVEYVVDDALELTYSEYAKVILLNVLDECGIKKFKNLSNRIDTMQGLYAKAGEYSGDWAYVDISDAYYTIYKRFLRVQYKAGGYLSNPDDYPFPDDLAKRVKRSVYGIMRSNSVLLYVRQGNNLSFTHKANFTTLFNPDLVNLTNDILHMVGYYAVREFGAIYFNTDGAIVPLEKAKAYMDFLKELGFSSKIKHVGGKVDIKGVGAYWIGDIKTKAYDRLVGYRDFNNLVREDVYKWLYTKLKRFKL